MIIDYEDDGVIRWERNGEKKHAELIDLIEAYEDKRKHGRWIVDQKYGNDVMSGGRMVICSECGKGAFDKHNYCPNCGARMDEVEEWKLRLEYLL